MFKPVKIIPMSNKMTSLIAIRNLAKSKGVKKYYNMKKQELINAMKLRKIPFNVLQYNVQLDPTIFINNGAAKRASIIPRAVKKINNGNIDTIVLCEAFEDTATKKLTNGLKSLGWKHKTKVLPSRFGKFKNGGVMIVSKWPIEETKFHIYDSSKGADGLVAKGIVYSKIKKRGKIFHVFGTHLQAWNDAGAKKIRTKQIRELQKFAKQQKIPPGEPVIYSGDFNIDKHKYESRIKSMCRVLDVDIPKLSGKHKYTSDPETNSLVGDDGADSHYGCNKEYVCSICHSCNKKNPGACQNLPWWLGGTECEKTSKKASKVSCKCCPRELLDYILVSKKSHLLKSNSRVILLKSPKKFKVGFWRLKENMMVNPDFCTTDLSDHYPLLGEFEFLI